MGKAARDKGKRGELLLCQEIYARWGVVMERNLKQPRTGGVDLVPAGDPEGWDDMDKLLGKFAWEVKNQDSQKDIRAWWEQTCDQANCRIPVLAYKIPYRGWRFRMSLYDIIETCAGRDFDSTVEMTWDGLSAIMRREFTR